MKKQKKHTMLSLFSCCGGLDLGFEGGFQVFSKQIDENKHPEWIKEKSDDGSKILLEENDFTTIFANDIDKNALVTWTKYFQKTHSKNKAKYELNSIVELVKKAKNNEFSFPHADIVSGGFPCCDFSLAGKRQGFNSTKSDTETTLDAPSLESRGMLYYWMREVIDLVNPKMFIAENVKGMISLKDVKETIENDFRNIGGGYIVIPARVLHSGDYGVAQSRERIIFFGFNKEFMREEAIKALMQENISNEYDPYPIPTHKYTKNSSGDMPFVTIQDILGDLPEPEQSSDPSHQSYSKVKYLGKKSQGQTEVKLDGLGPTIRSKHHGNIEYRRLSASNGGTHTKELKEGKKERRLSVRECARIQSFPDDYEFVIKSENKKESVSASAAYVLVGNAVPPLLAYNIARNIQNKWNKYFK